jgi:hypothetical protein
VAVGVPLPVAKGVTAPLVLPLAVVPEGEGEADEPGEGGGDGSAVGEGEPLGVPEGVGEPLPLGAGCRVGRAHGRARARLLD